MVLPLGLQLLLHLSLRVIAMSLIDNAREEFEHAGFDNNVFRSATEKSIGSISITTF
jgi:hypothetical protein